MQGLEGNRFAIVSKTHHALVDGVSGVDLATVLFDANPVPVGLTPPIRPWEPQPEPSDAHLLARGVENVAKLPLRLGRRVLKTAQHPRETASQALEVAEGLGEVAWELMNPAPDVPLNAEIGPHRTYRWVHSQSRGLQDRQGHASAGRSTTSCSRSSPARCATGSPPAA